MLKLLLCQDVSEKERLGVLLSEYPNKQACCCCCCVVSITPGCNVVGKEDVAKVGRDGCKIGFGFVVVVVVVVVAVVIVVSLGILLYDGGSLTIDAEGNCSNGITGGGNRVVAEA